MPKAMNTARLTIYLNNSTVLTDEKTIVADTEMLTDLLDGASFPRRKEQTLTYTHRATGQKPTPGNYKQIERRSPRYPDADLQFLARSGASAFRQARQGMHREKAINSKFNVWLKIVVAAGATAILLLALTIAMLSSGPAEEETPEETPQEQPLPTIAPPLGFGIYPVYQQTATQNREARYGS